MRKRIPALIPALTGLWLGLFGGFFMAATATPAHAADAGGWDFITEQDPGASLTHLRIVIRSGSLSDPADRLGLAQFTARAMLRGTETRPYQDLSDAIENLGATISVHVDQTQTVFDCTVLTQNLDPFLDVLRDILTDPAFGVAEMNLLQKIMYGELTADLQDVQVLASRALMQAAYAGTAMANPVKGTIASVASITPQDVQSFYQAHYVRENMIVAVTSPMTREDLIQKLRMKLDPVGHGMLDAKPIPASTLQGRNAFIVDRKGMATVPVYIAVPGVADNDPRMPALDAGNFVFGDDFTSRLMQVLRAQNGWTYGAYSGYSQILAPNAQAGLFSLYLFPSAEYADQAIPKALSMLDDYAARGLSAGELNFARQSLVNRYPFLLDSAEKRLLQDIRAQETGRPVLTPVQYRDEMNSLDLTNANAAISAATKSRNLDIAAVGDADVLKPILAALPGVKSVKVIQINP